jgi:hypothetical protein
MRKIAPHTHDTEARPSCKTFSEYSHDQENSTHSASPGQLHGVENIESTPIWSVMKIPIRANLWRFSPIISANGKGETNLASREIEPRNGREPLALPRTLPAADELLRFAEKFTRGCN